MRPGLSRSQGRQAALALDLGAISVPKSWDLIRPVGSPVVAGAVCRRKKSLPSPTVRFWQGCVAFRRQATSLFATEAGQKPLDPLLLDIQVPFDSPAHFLGDIPLSPHSRKLAARVANQFGQ